MASGTEGLVKVDPGLFKLRSTGPKCLDTEGMAVAVSNVSSRLFDKSAILRDRADSLALKRNGINTKVAWY
jgi:hypothetical protein